MKMKIEDLVRKSSKPDATYGEVGTCESCYHEKVEVKAYRRAASLQRTDDADWNLCNICASTFVSNVIEYQQYDSTAKHLASAIAWIGNEILNAIREGEEVKNVGQ